MKLATIDWTALRDGSEQGTSEARLPRPDLADAIRGHAKALGVATRVGLVRRVARCLAPWGNTEEGALEEVCRALERRGDLLSGPRGQVAPGPLRFVQTTEERLLVVGSLPTRRLKELFPDIEITEGVNRAARALRVAAPLREKLGDALAAVGGAWLSAEAWSGLSRTPAADQAWLDDLAIRLKNEGETPGLDLPARWEEALFYSTKQDTYETPSSSRWRPSPANREEACLVRARQPEGYVAFGWGIPGAAGTRPHPFVPLTRDEAVRTERALDRAAGTPREARISAEADMVMLTLDFRVPVAEYRYLLAMCAETETRRRETRFMLEAAAWKKTRSTLEERLGWTTNSRLIAEGET